MLLATYVVRDNDLDNTRVNVFYTIDSANSWEKKTLTLTTDTTGAFGNDNDKSFGSWFLLITSGTSYIKYLGIFYRC